MTATRITAIRTRLEEAFSPQRLEIIDESHKHAGHPGARDGRGHFRVKIVSDRFKNVPAIQRHRMVFDALGKLMQTDIHALSIDAEEPQ